MKKSRKIPAAGKGKSGASANSGFQAQYSSGDLYSQDLKGWNPYLGSADSDYLFHRDTVVSRSRDIERNDGWASSILARHVDNVIGSHLRVLSKPNFKALGLDAAWAKEFGEEAESRFTLYADDPEFHIDASRNDDFTGLCRLAYAQRIIEGESLAIPIWNENKPAGRYATTIMMVDSDRLSNPYRMPDSKYLRHGIRVNDDGAPIAYCFTKAHPGDFIFGGAGAYEWEEIPAEYVLSAGGIEMMRSGVIHAFEKKRVGQSRGISLLSPIMERLKMVSRYDRYELQSALINAVLAAYITSPLDHEQISEAIDAGTLSPYNSGRADYHAQRSVKLNGARIPTLYPGEDIKTLDSTRPSGNFAEFERACLRNIAAGVGLSYEQLSQDWSQTNYSSARAALMEVWKTLSSARRDFVTKFASQVYILWMQEAIYRGDIKLPRGAPDFETAKAAYTRCKWIGQGRGYVDPEKEASAANMRINGSLSTLEDECAEQGKDYRDVLHQRKHEIDLMNEMGIPLPDWALNPAQKQMDRRLEPTNNPSNQENGGS